MKNALFLALVVATFIAANLKAQPVQDQAKPQDKLLTPEKYSGTLTKKVQFDYLVFLPKGYEANSEKEWPTILFLHGAGERGTNVWRTSIHGPSKYILQNPDFPFIMISPQCASNQVWSSDSLIGLLDQVVKNYRVDANRVYLTGLSMGGFGTWNLGTAFPERFAAIAPICGGGDRLNIILAARGYAPNKGPALRSLGIWAFHGAKDTVVPLEESERMVKALEQAKVNHIKFTIYPEAGHDAWTETYNNPELYSWFLQHTRGDGAQK